MSDIVSILSICGLGIVLNFCEIASLVHARRTKLPFDIALISLAVSDLLLAMASPVLGISISMIPRLVASEWFSKAITFCIQSSSFSSALHMLFIAFQRLVAVCYPLKASIWITRKRSIMTVLLLWLVSGAVAVPASMDFYIYQRMFICSPFLSTIIIIVCYFIISFKMMTRKAPAAGGQQAQNISVLVYSISITVIFMMCALPFAIFAIQEPVLLHRMRLPSYVLHLLYLQVVLDPVLYFFAQIWKKIKCGSVFQCCGSENAPAN